MESVKRHALTTTAPLAQWPDCCHLIETIFVRLCAIHKSPKKKVTGTVSRWDLILGDYRKIRQSILANATIMQQTTLQLVDVSHTTLVQWHNRRVKRQGSAVLMQGLQLPSQLSVEADPLLPAHVRPPSAPPQSGPAHHYHLPSSTVGQAHVKRKRNMPSAPGGFSPQAEKPQTQQQLFPAPPTGDADPNGLTGTHRACPGCCSTGSQGQPFLCPSCFCSTSSKTDPSCAAQHMQEMRAV